MAEIAAALLLALWALTLGVSYVGSPGFAAGVSFLRALRFSQVLALDKPLPHHTRG
jgi:hypothetical protein